jgi:hypothetical protein
MVKIADRVWLLSALVCDVGPDDVTRHKLPLVKLCSRHIENSMRTK